MRVTERPVDAPPSDTPCEVCGVELGDWWGVTVWKEFLTGRDPDKERAEIGKFLTYQPVHSRCWWGQNPTAVADHDQRVREIRDGYQLKREPTKREQDAAAKKKADADRKVS